ncbi:hypothetical protein [Cohnella herbarum]|uniref:Uncharacterized protein n=1 Tax=Cohnella herbarum TaxID=2728023 RepID=A0A7Z2VLW0_9BACL|nr:hypothetical protein [Cohnella herbarum]QJD85449.1 hypothetical protein HH215_21215 [Cohnella herbarum]
MDNLYGYLGMGFGFMFLLSGATIAIVSIQQKFKTKHMELMNAGDIAREEHYRQLAESSLYVQQQMKDGQNQVLQELKEIRARLSAVEKLLREVE